MLKYIKPPVTLMLISFICTALLIVTYKATYVDTSKVLTDALREACVSTLGDGEYSITDDTAEGVAKVIKAENGNGIAFEIITKGYNKDGIDVLVAVGSDGRIAGVVPIAINETPGLGTKVSEESFLAQFEGAASPITAVKAAKAENEITAVTGATRSSNGVTQAVNLALSAFEQLKGAYLGE